MTESQFKYRREDFGELPIKLDHLTIYLNFLDDRVEAVNLLHMRAKEALDTVLLDARELEILSIELCPNTSESAVPLQYHYDRNACRLIVRLPKVVRAGEVFRIKTVSHCYPSDHVLEGIYKDATPSGAPQQYMSQCQQWGFQRIMPIFDDCRAKCTMTTTLEADARYTHLISSGNVNRETNPTGKPIPKPGHAGRQVITFENTIPMAPYLFIACAGTWDEAADSVTYPSGRSVRLEYLVPPGQVEGARVPMEILKKSVLWVAQTQEYEYTGDTYRTICMGKSNFGGMENVGNTTIVTDAALINEHTMDIGLLYAHAVIAHEFEHNQCGSETTMETPFDVWLNEAYTVDVERRFMADHFNPVFVRLTQVDSIRNPLLGPLAIEDGGHAGRIARTGFNDPDELIDGVTYVKAAEVIRMLRLILGEERFGTGKRLYFERYRFGNADSDQFFNCFEEASGVSLHQFKSQWLHTIGYPSVTTDSTYDASRQEFRIRFRQQLPDGASPFHLPIILALTDDHGRDIEGTEQVFELKEGSAELILKGIPKPPAFPSINRSYSFYGTFRQRNISDAILEMQAKLDPDSFNRVDAMKQFTDRQRIRILLDPNAEACPEWLNLYGEILSDRNIPSSLAAYFLRIDEQPLDRTYAVWYPELVAAREKLMRAVNRLHRSELIRRFLELKTYTVSEIDGLTSGVEDRLLKQVLLDLIANEDTAESHQIILDHLKSSTTANDRVTALAALNRSSAPERLKVLDDLYQKWHRHLSGYANYLKVISSGTCPDVFDLIERERSRPTFDVTQPTWSRALFLPMAANNKMIWKDEGIRWLTETIIHLAPVNATTTGRLLNTFQHVRKLKPNLQEKVKPALQMIVEAVPEESSPSIHRQALAYLGDLLTHSKG